MNDRLASGLHIDVTRQEAETAANRFFRGSETRWKVVLLLTVIVLLTPHTVSIERATLTDSTYETISWIAILWVFSHAEGSNLAGPFSTSVLSLPNPIQLVWGGISLIVSLYTFRVVRRFASKPDLRRFGMQLVPAILFLFLLFGLFSYSLDSWMSALTLPFPIAVVTGSAVVYGTTREKE